MAPFGVHFLAAGGGPQDGPEIGAKFRATQKSTLFSPWRPEVARPAPGRSEREAAVRPPEWARRLRRRRARGPETSHCSESPAGGHCTPDAFEPQCGRRSLASGEQPQGVPNHGFTAGPLSEPISGRRSGPGKWPRGLRAFTAEPKKLPSKRTPNPSQGWQGGSRRAADRKGFRQLPLKQGRKACCSRLAALGPLPQLSRVGRRALRNNMQGAQPMVCGGSSCFILPLHPGIVAHTTVSGELRVRTRSGKHRTLRPPLDAARSPLKL